MRIYFIAWILYLQYVNNEIRVCMMYASAAAAADAT